MSVVKIDYSEIKSAGKKAAAVAQSYERIAYDLDNRLIKKIDSARGYDQSGYAGQARSVIARKISDANRKKDKFNVLKNDLVNLADKAKTYENNAKNKINRIGTESLELKKQKWYQKAGQWLYGTICVDILNGNPLTRGIGNLVKGGLDELQYYGSKAVDWFKHGAGKYVLNIIKEGIGVCLAIFGTIGAIALCVGTGGAAAPLVVAAVASAIGTVMTAVDSTISICQNIKALKIQTNDPGRARFYGSISGYSDYTKKTDYGGEKENKKHEELGEDFDTAHTIMDITAFAAGAYGSAGLKETIVKDPAKGTRVEITYDSSFAKSNVKKIMADKAGFKNVNGKWELDPKQAFSWKSRKSGPNYAKDLAVKHAKNRALSSGVNSGISKVEKVLKNTNKYISIGQNTDKVLHGQGDNLYKNLVKPVISLGKDLGPHVFSGPFGDVKSGVIPIIDLTSKHGVKPIIRYLLRGPIVVI